jgi:hypothetical protein
MEIEVRIHAVACWCYIASWSRAPLGIVERHVPGSLQEVVPSNTKREWKEKKTPDKTYDPENKFKWQDPRSEVPVMYWNLKSEPKTNVRIGS